MDNSLPIGKRLGVRLHLIICKWCARYERQLLLIRETARRLVATVEAPGETLSEEAKERIRKTIKNP
jgi:hypothetical protein